MRIAVERGSRTVARVRRWSRAWAAILTFVLAGPAMELAGRALIRA